MKKLIKPMLLLGLLSPINAAMCADLKPFVSDGCSSFPDGTLQQKNLWHQCCEAHDVAYWQGGTSNQRKAADETLQSCVASVGQPQIAKLMLAGVRVGGSPYWPTSYRWGYGWEYPKGYAELTVKERQQIADKWALYLQSKTNEQDAN